MEKESFCSAFDCTQTYHMYVCKLHRDKGWECSQIDRVYVRTYDTLGSKDTLFQEGFTYQVCMRNDTDTSK